jgi:hypothetical protein
MITPVIRLTHNPYCNNPTRPSWVGGRTVVCSTSHASSAVCYLLCSSALRSTLVFLFLILIASLFYLFSVSRGHPTSRLRPQGRGQLKARSDIDLSFNRYHHLRCRILWIPTIVPHLPTIVPHLLTGLPRPTVLRLHPTPLPRACRPARSHQVRLPTQPPSDRMERPYIIHSSTSFILLHVPRFGSHFAPTELFPQGNLTIHKM